MDTSLKKAALETSDELARTISFIILCKRFARNHDLLMTECQEVVEVYLSANPSLPEVESVSPGFRGLACSLREAQRLADVQRALDIVEEMHETLLRIQRLPVERWFALTTLRVRSRVGPW